MQPDTSKRLIEKLLDTVLWSSEDLGNVIHCGITQNHRAK